MSIKKMSSAKSSPQHSPLKSCLVANLSLEDVDPTVVSTMLKRMNYQDLDEFNKLNPDFTFQLMIPKNKKTSKRKRTGSKKHCVLSKFTFLNYKKCLLVKHPDGLDNEGQIPGTFKLPGFSRPMYWNKTLAGWVASPTDEQLLCDAGASREV